MKESLEKSLMMRKENFGRIEGLKFSAEDIMFVIDLWLTNIEEGQREIDIAELD